MAAFLANNARHDLNPTHRQPTGNRIHEQNRFCIQKNQGTRQSCACAARQTVSSFGRNSLACTDCHNGFFLHCALHLLANRSWLVARRSYRYHPQYGRQNRRMDIRPAFIYFRPFCLVVRPVATWRHPPGLSPYRQSVVIKGNTQTSLVPRPVHT